MATCRMLDIAVASGRRCGPARARARHLPMGQLSHHAERGSNRSGPRTVDVPSRDAAGSVHSRGRTIGGDVWSGSVKRVAAAVGEGA
ncbi:hypothetical protein J4G37_22045 [Microvirga sp. 3-52]|nr:hypothetical protein [Microvirga sp. 3-52]